MSCGFWGYCTAAATLLFITAFYCYLINFQFNKVISRALPFNTVPSAAQSLSIVLARNSIKHTPAVLSLHCTQRAVRWFGPQFYHILMRMRARIFSRPWETHRIISILAPSKLFYATRVICSLNSSVVACQRRHFALPCYQYIYVLWAAYYSLRTISLCSETQR